MTIQDVKKEPILQVSSQEPQCPPIMDFEDKGFLTHFYARELKFGTQDKNHIS